MKRYYPIMLDISNKECVIFGGGNVALRKVRTLLEYNANITVISNKICEQLLSIEKEGKIVCILKNYEPNSINSAYLIFAATDDNEINKLIYQEAQSKDILVNVVDSIELCNFIVPSVLEQGDLTISISTNGKSPLMAQKIRMELQEKFGQHYAEFLEIMGVIRQKSLKEIPDETQRKALFEELINSNFIDLLKEGKRECVLHEINVLYEKYKSRESNI